MTDWQERVDPLRAWVIGRPVLIWQGRGALVIVGWRPSDWRSWWRWKRAERAQTRMAAQRLSDADLDELLALGDDQWGSRRVAKRARRRRRRAAAATAWLVIGDVLALLPVLKGLGLPLETRVILSRTPVKKPPFPGTSADDADDLREQLEQARARPGGVSPDTEADLLERLGQIQAVDDLETLLSSYRRSTSWVNDKAIADSHPASKDVIRLRNLTASEIIDVHPITVQLRRQRNHLQYKLARRINEIQRLRYPLCNGGDDKTPPQMVSFAVFDQYGDYHGRVQCLDEGEAITTITDHSERDLRGLDFHAVRLSFEIQARSPKSARPGGQCSA